MLARKVYLNQIIPKQTFTGACYRCIEWMALCFNILARIIETIQAATQEIIKSYGPYIRGPREAGDAVKNKDLVLSKEEFPLLWRKRKMTVWFFYMTDSYNNTNNQG